MKANRKNKKLSFIRIKNLLRTGKRKFYCIKKVDYFLSDKEVENLFKKAEDSLFKSYKLNLPKSSIQKGFTSDDFLQNLNTYRVELYLK